MNFLERLRSLGNEKAEEELNEDELFFEQDPELQQEDPMRMELHTFKYNSKGTF